MGERCSINKLNTSFTFIIPVIDFQSGPPGPRIINTRIRRNYVQNVPYRPAKKEKEIKKKAIVLVWLPLDNITSKTL